LLLPDERLDERADDDRLLDRDDEPRYDLLLRLLRDDELRYEPLFLRLDFRELRYDRLLLSFDEPRERLLTLDFRVREFLER